MPTPTSALRAPQGPFEDLVFLISHIVSEQIRMRAEAAAAAERTRA